MTLKLYYALGSPPSRAVLLLLRKLNIDVEVKIVNLAAGEHLEEVFLKLNPLHQVPVLVDGDFILTESRAMMAYIVGKYAEKSTLYPSDIVKRARIDEKLHYDATVLFPAVSQIICTVLFERVKKIPANQREKLINTLEILEGFLSKNMWFAGNEMTIADISIVPTITTVKELGLELSMYPKIIEWYARLEASLPKFEDNVHGAKDLAKRMLSIMDDKL